MKPALPAVEAFYVDRFRDDYDKLLHFDLEFTACRRNLILHFCQRNSPLPHILTFSVGVRGLARVAGFKKDHLSNSFVGINHGRKWRGVGNFQRHMPFPFRFKWCYVHNDAAAGIG